MHSLNIDFLTTTAVSALCGGAGFLVPTVLGWRRSNREMALRSSALTSTAEVRPTLLQSDELQLPSTPITSTFPILSPEVLPASEMLMVPLLDIDVATAETGPDTLTRLPQRVDFAAQFETVVRRARTGGLSSSIMLIDLEGRQKINDQYGQKFGNQALAEISRRLQTMLKKSEMLARLGEDQFAVITDGLAELEAHRNAVGRLARRMIYNIRQPVVANYFELHFDASIGVTLCRSENCDSQDLLQSAADAMQRAKSSPARFGLADQRQAIAPVLRDDHIEHDLLRAMAAGEIVPFYQPVIDLAAQRICGFEALARWKHPTRGLIAPDSFIPLLESIGMMPELTDTILSQVCRDAQHWPEEIHVAVNVSPSELSDVRLPERILGIIERQRFAPKRLVIEITETALVQDTALAKEILEAFTEAGIMIALDDFGTGYASLGQLQQLRFDCLKIDRSFVQSMRENNHAQKIVDAIIGLARSLNLKVIAEGVETELAAAILTTRGCDFGQGFYYGEAVNAQQATKLLSTEASKLNTKELLPTQLDLHLAPRPLRHSSAYRNN